jgi:hypothetical protein
VTDLQRVGTGANGWETWSHYIQTAHINLNGVANWTPLCSSGSGYLSGSYDGDGFTISNLKINDAANNNKGLFRAVGGSGGTVKNVALKGINIIGGTDVGGIAGEISLTAKIQNCYVTGSVSGVSGVGGIVGYMQGGTVENCYTVCTIIGTGVSIGGIAGGLSAPASYTATVQYCYATGTVETTYQTVAGIAGRLNSSRDNVKNCVALQTLIKSPIAAYAMRVAGSSNGTLSNNYGRGAMTLVGGRVPVGDGYADVDGKTIDESLINGHSSSRWSAIRGSFGPGFGLSNWDIKPYSLPHLFTTKPYNPIMPDEHKFREAQNPEEKL